MQRSSYEAEVLVNGKPLKEYAHDGRVYVEGRKGTPFSIRLRNNTGVRKLFVPSIDGLSVLNGEECGLESGGYIVGPYSAVTVDGWRISDSEVAQFFFSSPDESYRRRMERGNNLGVIGVAVFAEKEKPQPIVVREYIPQPHHCHDNWCWVCQRHHCHDWSYHPGMCNGSITFANNTGTAPYPLGGVTQMSAGLLGTEFPNTSSTGGHSGSAMFAASTRSEDAQASVSQDLGIGWGDARRSEVREVEFEREGSLAAIFEIFYNTREQLERSGVDFRKEPMYVAPQAFPGRYCEPPKR